MDPSRIAAIPLFRGLDTAEIAAAASQLEVVEGATVVAEGDFGNALFAIESGRAEVSSGGKRVAILGPGDVFGEIAVLASGRRTASVVALTPMRLIALFKTDVWALERRAPAAGDRLRALISERLSEFGVIKAAAGGNA